MKSDFYEDQKYMKIIYIYESREFVLLFFIVKILKSTCIWLGTKFFENLFYVKKKLGDELMKLGLEKAFTFFVLNLLTPWGINLWVFYAIF